MEILNRKASHDYFIKHTIEAGIELKGTEIKSIREGNANINDAYARIKNYEVFLTNMYIARYKEGNIFNHDERRERKLLLHKNEILKIRDKIEIKGYTLVPIKLYFSKNKAKILLGIGKGKKVYDKMWAKAKKYFRPGIELIVSPVAFVTGTVVYTANIAISPILAIFSKGGKLFIPKNSTFEIKMLDDAFICK